MNPRELPADITPFCGRAADLLALDETLAEQRATKLVAICGTAGVGKTALAVHWAHREAGGFPDGQLYINLCGYDTTPPVTTSGAVTSLLRSLLPAGAPIPAGDREQFSLYRSLTADRKLLVVLDNATTPETVRPLIPAGPDCVVIVTSRDAMPGLVARDGAHRLDLMALPQGDAYRLLNELVGDRASADADATRALAERCARLPLALRLAAELAVSRPSASIRTLLDDLDGTDTLDEFDTSDDPQTSLRAVFSWSYQQLRADAARAFRLLGVHPGRSYDAYAVAALMDCSLGEARALLRTLTRAHLLERLSNGRVTMHDLLHAYAVELAQLEPTADQALARLLDYFVYVAAHAGDVVHPYPRPGGNEPLNAKTPVPDLSAKPDALAWLDAERPNLLAVAHASHDVHVLALSNALRRYLNFCGHLGDALNIHQLALTVASERDDVGAKARALSGLGLACGQSGRFAEAADYARRATVLARQVDDQITLRGALSTLGLVLDATGDHDAGRNALTESLELARGRDSRMEAAALNNLGLCHEHAGRYEDALELYSQATERYREAGWRPGEGEVFYNTGNINLRLNRPAAALEFCQRALAIAHETGSIELEMGALNSLGVAHRTLDQLDDAAARHNQALSLAQRVGDRIEVARALDGLGTVARRAGNVNDAHAFWTEALAIYTDVGVPQAAEVRAKLGALGRLAVAS
jgi:tetratricopeptide (TPR) repeat protein